MSTSECSVIVMPIKDGLIRFQNQIFTSNSYVWTIPGTDACVLIDPGLDGHNLDCYLEKQQLHPELIVCTHGHFDHLGSVELFQKKYQATCYLHHLDVKTSKSSNFLMMACKIPAKIQIPSPDFLIDDGYAIPIGSSVLRFHHTPGHTPGSCFIELDDFIFSGDTLYKSSIGLVDLPGEDKEGLRKSILKMINKIPGNKLVCPGHGGAAPLERIIDTNMDLRAFLGLTCPTEKH